jgi:hypothetical protein
VIPLTVGGALLWACTIAAACALVLASAATAPASRSSPPVAGAPPPTVAHAPTALALTEIPPAYLALYRAAAARFGLDWTILAGIGRVECDHGQDPAPSCTVEGQLNSAGAGGPAQFLVSTWRRYGITPSGRGTPDMWNAADAIFSMANYLRAAGAPGDYREAIYAYNHAWWYVAEVLMWARRYRDG